MSNFLKSHRRKLCAAYASAELLWYLARESDITRIVAYAPQYERFAEANVAYGAYGARIQQNTTGTDQFDLALQLLKRDPNTRQCVVSLWSANDLLVLQQHKDIPCTISWQFLLRDEQLHMINTMRSQDVWLGLPYDVFVNTCIQYLFANELGVTMGTYTHQCGSLHLYERNAGAAAEAMYEVPCITESNFWNSDDTFSMVPVALKMEEALRLHQTFDPTAYAQLGSMFQGIIANCARKWGVTIC